MKMNQQSSHVQKKWTRVELSFFIHLSVGLQNPIVVLGSWHWTQFVASDQIMYTVLDMFDADFYDHASSSTPNKAFMPHNQ